MAQVGRISGPLLEANLLRNNIDLAFRNDLDTTQLLYLDVNNGRIGVNNSTPTNELQTLGTTRTTYLLGDYGRVSGFTVNNSTFSAIGNIELDAAEAVVMPALDNGTLFIDGNYISSHISNSNIDLTPHGTGSVDTNSINVYGDLYTPGNITLEGTITFGDADTDAVDFNADVNSDIIPNINDTYNLGSNTKRWENIYTNLLNGQAVSTDNLQVGLIDYTLTPGQIFFVAQRGTDTNSGDHILAPVASIKRALELAADSNGNPVTIYVAPGDYEEETPLVIPTNVSVIGEDLRNVNVFPTSYTLSEDVFHLNDSSTVSDITIKNFYYDSNKGYAFRYAPGAVITNRSPYIKNVTVITRGSNVTVDDPLGFDSGDAGHGAYIDGAELDPASREASMLFHSVTMITPGVDAVTMTNGVRVEWLNSFTYFANRGLYAFNNSTGRITHDGSTISRGAEIRSIGSANVYGNYGAVADGSDTLMYLINHNFGYIGSGKDSSNDPSLVIQANEALEENSGKIYYVSQDQYGTLRVGDNFYVDFETGSTSIDLSSLTATSLNGIVITGGTDSTVITGAKVETGNIKISSNVIESLSGDLIVDAATNEINYNDNVNVSSNIELTGDLSFGGSLNLLGDQTTDAVKFNVDFDQNFNPYQDLQFDLGSTVKRWKNIYISEANISDIRIFDNIIETKTSNADLELRANGTGEVVSQTNNAQIDNNLTVSGSSSLSDVVISGPMSITGNLEIVGDHSVSNNFSVAENLTVTAATQFEEINIDGNVITSTSTNTDLELRANGTGDILVPYNDINVTNNLVADNIQIDTNASVTTDVEFNTANVSSVRVAENYITTSISNSDLELRASGTGNILIPDNNVEVDNNLTVSGTTDLQETLITGSLSQTGNKTQVGNYNQYGDLFIEGNLNVNSQAQLENILIDDNFITTTFSNSNLELRAAGSGVVLVPDNNVTINNNLFASSLQAQNIIIDQDLVLNEIIIPPSIIEIDDNFITTKISNADLDLRANGIGQVLIPNNDVIIEQDLTVNGITDIDNISITGSLAQTGNTTQTGNYNLSGSLDVNGPVEISSASQFENIRIEGNVLSTTLSNSDIELRAQGTGNVKIPNNNVSITNNLSTGTLTSAGIVINNSFALELLESSTDIEIFDNVITTTNSNSNLELRAAGSGSIYLQQLEFNTDTISTATSNITVASNNVIIDSTGSLKLPTSASELTSQGYIKFDSTTGLFEGYNNSVVTLSGIYSDNRLTSVTAHPTNNLLYFTVNGIQVASIDSDEMYVHGLLANSVSIQNSTITTIDSNADLEITANGTGEVVIGNLSIIDSMFKNNSTTGLTFSNTNYGYVKFNSENGVVVPNGGTGTQPVADPEVGDTRWNTDTQLLETWDGTEYITSAGVSAAITEEEYNNLLLEYTIIFG